MDDMRVNDWIRRHMDPPVATMADIEQGVRDARSADFERARGWFPYSETLELARNARLRMGYLRYRHVLGNGPYAHLASVGKHMQAYQADGNQEHLVDACNLTELEWITPEREGTSYPLAAPVRAHWATCIEQYRTTGYRQWLVSLANQIQLEFVYPTHPKAHFKAIDDGEHTEYL